MARSFSTLTDRIQWGGDNNATEGCIAFFMRTTQVTTSVVPISCWSTSSRNGYGFILNHSLWPNKILVAGYSASTNAFADNLRSTSDVNDGDWHHIAFNFQTALSSTSQLFIDGVLEQTAAASVAWNIGATVQNTLGDNVDSFWANYTGEFAEVAYWKGVRLAADQIAMLAKGLRPSRVRWPNLYAPLVRSAKNRCYFYIASDTGGVAAHPRVFG